MPSSISYKVYTDIPSTIKNKSKVFFNKSANQFRKGITKIKQFEALKKSELSNISGSKPKIKGDTLAASEKLSSSLSDSITKVNVENIISNKIADVKLSTFNKISSEHTIRDIIELKKGNFDVSVKTLNKISDKLQGMKQHLSLDDFELELKSLIEILAKRKLADKVHQKIEAVCSQYLTKLDKPIENKIKEEKSEGISKELSLLVKIAVKPNPQTIPSMMESINFPERVESYFYNILKINHIKKESLNSLSKEIDNIKNELTSDDFGLKLYDLCHVISDLKYKSVTNEFIVNYLNGMGDSQQLNQNDMIDVIENNLSAIKQPPVKLMGNVNIFEDVNELINEINNKKEMSDTQLYQLDAKINTLKEKEIAESFILKMEALWGRIVDTAPNDIIEKMSLIFAKYINVNVKVEDFSNIEYKNKKPEKLSKRILKGIEWAVFVLAKKVKNMRSNISHFFQR